MIQTIKVNVNGFYRNLHILQFEDRIYIKFDYNKVLLEEVKALAGARWHPDVDQFPTDVAAFLKCTKCWSADNKERNWVQLRYLSGKNPFVLYDQEIKSIPPVKRTASDGKTYDVYPHQLLMTGHQLGLRRVITAAEMGCGKTLSVILTMEYSDPATNDPFWYVSTKSGLYATMLELKFWQTHVVPHLFTYEELVRLLRTNPDIPPPPFIVFDESVCIKNIAAQRTQAAMYIANRMRQVHGEAAYIICMSGAPAPLDPTDWWSQAEVVFPGFLREGDPSKFARRLSFVEKGESATGGAYSKRISWRDNPEKCNECGVLRGDHIDICDHRWAPSANEIERLGKRLGGLVLTIRKKDVLAWLPPKIYRVVRCKPSASILRAAKVTAARSIPSIQKLVLLRMLSDGFRYSEADTGQTKLCPSCEGKGEINDYDPVKDEMGLVVCPTCKGARQVAVWARSTDYVACPKDDVVRDLLEECESTGRIVGYAGFTGSVDRVCNVCTSNGWGVIRADGRGWHGLGSALSVPAGKWLEAFQHGQKDYPKLAFIGQPGAAGTGVTLTAAELMFFFSNDFNAGNRIQAEDRIHRPGTTGATIVDIVNLTTDDYVRNALQAKRDLQQMTLDANLFEGQETEGE